ncbi:aldo/keto reductase [Nocardioides sp. KIGAM211]|uniref:Aldo/keto reductase n=1 Tax=Nocardioides luti TaxID=2761101 RepID=A0A7X0RG79_9ACTN|nr:aldo/keto reductase [Nocardioides luti]MBB6627712.1 aldo/keto reductase [Nocardioides luti]
MKARTHGALALTELGLGGAQLGNLYRAISDETAAATVAAAWDAGIRYFDTAPHYGVGLAERRLGRALAERPRDDYVLSTKVGRLLVDDPAGAGRRDAEGFDVPASTRRVWDFSRDGVRRSVEESLTRLGLDRIDVAFLHDPEDHWEQALAEGLPALVELREEGVLGAVGAGMNFAAPLTELVREHDVDLVMCAGRHTLLEQADELLDAALAHGVGVVAAGVYNSGLLARPRPAADAHYNYAPAPSELLARVHALADACEAHGVSLPEAALAFPFRHPAVVSVVVGAAAPGQVADAVDRHRRTIPDDLWTDLALARPATEALEGP